jgi:hypothetical protein
MDDEEGKVWATNAAMLSCTAKIQPMAVFHDFDGLGENKLLWRVIGGSRNCSTRSASRMTLQT